MEQNSLNSQRPRRTYTPQFKAELVAQYLQGHGSLTSLAVGHGMNPNVLHRWVREHERYGKHSLDEFESVSSTALVTCPPANWIPLSQSPDMSGHRAAASAPVKTSAPKPGAPSEDTIELSLTGRGGVTLTLHWPVREHQSLAAWARAVLA